VLWFSSCRYGVALRVTCPVCGMLPRTHFQTSHLYPVIFTVHFTFTKQRWDSLKCIQNSSVIKEVSYEIFIYIQDNYISSLKTSRKNYYKMQINTCLLL
jgi:hypothetical protein